MIFQEIKDRLSKLWYGHEHEFEPSRTKQIKESDPVIQGSSLVVHRTTYNLSICSCGFQRSSIADMETIKICDVERDYGEKE